MSASGRSRAAALTLAAGVLALASAAVVVPAAAKFARDGDRIAAAQGRIDEAAARRASDVALGREGEAWEAWIASPASGLLRGGDAGEAAEARLREAFAEAGGSLGSVEASAAPSGRDGASRVAVAAQGSVPRGAVPALMAALEARSPYMIVDGFAAEASGGRMALTLSGVFFQREAGR